jgi:hypothetical protein
MAARSREKILVRGERARNKVALGWYLVSYYVVAFRIRAAPLYSSALKDGNQYARHSTRATLWTRWAMFD